MKSFEFITEGNFNWHDYDSMPYKDRIVILEAHLESKGNLLETNDADVAEYFQSLVVASTEPLVRQSYIFCPLALIKNTLIAIETTLQGTLTGITQDNEYEVKTTQGTLKTLPVNYVLRNGSLSHTFCFNNIEEYNKFRTLVRLKFSKELHEI